MYFAPQEGQQDSITASVSVSRKLKYRKSLNKVSKRHNFLDVLLRVQHCTLACNGAPILLHSSLVQTRVKKKLAKFYHVDQHCSYLRSVGASVDANLVTQAGFLVAHRPAIQNRQDKDISLSHVFFFSYSPSIVVCPSWLEFCLDEESELSLFIDGLIF